MRAARPRKLVTSRILVGLLVSGHGLHADGAAAADKSLEPSSPWTLEGSEESCSLLRNFGSGNDHVQLQIDSFGRADKLTITLVGRPVPRPRNLRDQLRYEFDADTDPRRTVSTNGRSGRASWVKFDTSFHPADAVDESANGSREDGYTRYARAIAPDPDFEQRVRKLSVQFDRDSHLELALGSMAQPLDALRACLGELHRHWGLDSAQQQTISRFPIPDPSAVQAVMADYPAVMASKGTNAYIPVRVMVGADGTAGLCVAQLPGVAAAFTTAICTGLNRRFAPAMNAAGDAVPSFFQVHVLYSMD